MQSQRGSVGLILTILVLGFMMAVSSSFVMMVNTEVRTQGTLDKNGRARDAAFAGVNYVIARLQATSSTILVSNSAADIKGKRLYFSYDATASSKNIRFSGYGGTPATDFANVASSQWLFPLTDGLLLEDEVASSVCFRVTSYPATNSLDVVTPDFYYVKSQGMFRDIESGTVMNTFSAQLLARLQIATNTLSVRLERYQVMETEPLGGATSDFFSKRRMFP